MFSNLHNPSNMCGLGASHSAFRQVTGTDASRPLRHVTSHDSLHLVYLASQSLSEIAGTVVYLTVLSLNLH